MTQTAIAHTRVVRWRTSLFAMFTVFGLSLASWVTRTPDIRDSVQASTAVMGLVLAGLSIGSLIGITATGRLVVRHGTRPVIAVAGTATVVGLVGIALGTAIGTPTVVGLGLGLFGLGLGSCEVAINVDGSAVEHASGRSVLPILHGFFSIGTLVGALAGMAFSAMRTSVPLHLATAAVVMGATTAWAVRGVPAGQRSTPTAHAGGPAPAIWRDRTVLLIGVIVLGMAFAEGTANDWLPLIAVDGFGASPTVGAFAFALFTLMMGIGRFGGHWVLDRMGRAAAIRTTALLAAAGILVLIIASNAALGALGIVLWGLGASLGFPVALSAAGDDPEHSAARVSAVATVGYLAFLAGPPLLGLLGESVGLRNATGTVLIAVMVSAACASAAGQRHRPVDEAGRHDGCDVQGSSAAATDRLSGRSA